MNHKDKVKAILFIRPNAEFVLRDLDIEWMDTNQTQPTEEEIEAGWIAYQAKVEADKAEAEAKRQALLAKLGITEEEAKLLLS
jgi:hypothetical protein